MPCLLTDGRSEKPDAPAPASAPPGWLEASAASAPLAAGVACFFASLPCMYALTLRASSCGAGPPMAAYAVMCVGVLVSSLVDVPFLMGWWPERFLSVAPEQQRVGVWRLQAGRGLDRPLVIFLLGKLELFDALTDAAQPAQVASCEAARPEMLEQFREGWRPLGLEDRVPPLSALLLGFLLSSYALQALLLGHAVLRYGRATLEEAGKRGTPLLTIYARSAEAAAAAAAEVLGSLGASTAARAAREASCMGMRYLTGQDVERLEQAKRLVREPIMLRETLARVLLEAAPALYFAVAFLALTKDSLDAAGLAKAVLTLALSLVTCCHKAAKCVAMDGWGGKAVGVAIAAWSVAMAAKFVGVFRCESHQLNIFGGCVERVLQ